MAREIFGNYNFSTSTYQSAIKTVLLEHHDWGNENSSFKNQMISLFGEDNWKERTADAMSWIGLTRTDSFSDYLNSLPGNLPFYYAQIAVDRLYINNANKSCN